MSDDKPRTILYVEDNDGDVMLLRQAFEECRIPVEIQVIDNGIQALRYFRIKESARDAPPPDLILLDLHLPGHSGAELLDFINGSEFLRNIPTFMFVAEVRAAAHETRERELCLEKPEDWDGYLALVDELASKLVTR